MRKLSILSLAAGAIALAACTTSSGTDGGTGDGGGGGPTCANYCTTITTNCHDANRQYGDAADEAMTNCMAACNGYHWTPGTMGDTSGDTLGCHLYHATAAAGDPATHCPHAGPLGGGMCGSSQCADFCAANTAVCGTMAYASTGACMTACMGFSDQGANIASPTAVMGNTLSCRAYHLSAAASDPATHCAHTNAAGGGTCI